LPDEVAVINLDGTGRRSLVMTDELVEWLGWMPDGRLAYSTERWEVGEANRLTPLGRLYAVDPAGGPPEVLAEGGGRIRLEWSPDRVWAAVILSPSRTYQTLRVTLKRLDTGQEQEIPAGGGGRWMADGSFTFIGRPGSEQKLLRVVPGEQPTPVFPQHTFLQESGWRDFVPNPDGSLLLIISDDESREVVDMHTGEITEVPGSVGARVGDWSPSGDELLVRTGGLYLGEPPEPRLSLFHARTATSRVLLAGTYTIGSAWLPDGRHIVYSVPYGDERGLYLMDIQTLETSRIATAERATRVGIFLGGRILMLAETCIVCDLAIFPFTLIGYGWTHRVEPTHGRPIDVSEDSIAWGGSSLARARADGTIGTLDSLPGSLYRHILPATQQGELIAFSRTTSWGPESKAFEVDVYDGTYIEVPAAPRAARPAATATPDPLLPSVPVPVTDCSPPRVPPPIVSPDGRLAAVIAGCNAGVYLVEVATGARVLAVRSGACLFGHPKTIEAEWLDTRRLLLTSYGECI
jgi:hypothetical protein